MKRLLLTIFFFCNMLSCEVQKTGVVSIGSQEEKNYNKVQCKVTGLAHNGCCSLAGGARECGRGAYFYSGSNFLQFNDLTTFNMP
jgi:hypothetical protein